MTGTRRETALRVTFPFQDLPTLDHDPEAVALLEQGPVVLASMGPMDVWLALSYRAVRQVFADPRFSREAATRPGGPVTTPLAANPVLISSLEGTRHTRIRKPMGQAFSPRMAEQLEPRIQSIVDSLLAGLPDSADLVESLCSPLPTMVICELLGAPYSDSADIRRMSKRLFRNTITPADLAAAEPVELDGVQLPADAPVVPILNAANRDPSVYPEPDRLDLTRDAPPHVGFGHGPHFCLGGQLARLELRVALATTVTRFPGLRLAVDPDELTYDRGSVLRSLNTLPVELSGT
jgi:cytochrome P450